MSDIDATANVGDRTIIIVDGIKVSVRPNPFVSVQVAAGRKGDKGDKGDEGTPAPSFVYDQASPSMVWTIAHNLGFYPAVFTYSVGGVEMIGSVINLSLNELQVMFEIPVAGTARLN